MNHVYCIDCNLSKYHDIACINDSIAGQYVDLLTMDFCSIKRALTSID
jgi:hypothetical protein